MPTPQPYGIRQTFTFRDKRGFTAVTRVYFRQQDRATAAAAASTLATALAAISHSATVLTDDGATVQVKSNGIYTTTAQPLTGATTGFYDTVADKLVLLFDDLAGVRHKYQIPCPLETVWLPDDEEADQANTLLTAVTGAMVGHCCSPSGFLLASFGGAYRSRTQTPRRLSSFIKDTASPANIVWP